MATKTKVPPAKTGAEVLAMLKLPKNRTTSGWANKLANLLSFLQLTSGNRISAEIVETDINIDDSGKVLSLESVRQDFINDKMHSVEFFVKEENELYGKINEAHREMRECEKIVNSRAKVNTDEKKEKAQNRINELRESKNVVQAELNELRQKINELKAEERRKLEAMIFPIEEMRERFDLLVGVKIKITLGTGSYTFPVPTIPSFYGEVCGILGLPFFKEVKPEPKVLRTFTMTPDVVDAMRKAITFCSDDDLRPAFMCVNLEIEKGKMLVVATDAHRLFMSRKFEVVGKGNVNYLLPASALKKLPKKVDEEFEFIEFEDGTVSFLGLRIHLCLERFPNWRVVMPEYGAESVIFNRLDMISAVKQTLVYANKRTAQVNIHFNGCIEFAAQDVDFSFEAGSRMAYKKKTMQDLLIAFNGRLLNECLSIFKTEEITFKAEKATLAAILTDGKDTALLMPLMLNN